MKKIVLIIILGIVFVGVISSIVAVVFMKQLMGNIPYQFKNKSIGNVVAAQVGAFTAPSGFQEVSLNLRLPFLGEGKATPTVMLVSLQSPHAGMTIALTNVEDIAHAKRSAAEDSAAGNRCASLSRLPNEIIKIAGKPIVFHRFTCMTNKRRLDEFEVGSFIVGKPITHVVKMLAFGPKESWDPQPIHALLQSFR